MSLLLKGSVGKIYLDDFRHRMLMLRRGGINSKVHARVVKVTIIRMIRGIAKGGGGYRNTLPVGKLRIFAG